MTSAPTSLHPLPFTMKILLIGDIVGKAGRLAITELLPGIISQYQIDVCIANVENAAGGMGVTPAIANDFFNSYIQVLTSGNHIFDKKEIEEYIKHEPHLLRPANYPPEVPGTGSCIIELPSREKLGILNLAGRVFMGNLDCPFRVGLSEIAKIRRHTHNIVIDFHAEATSEKITFGWYVDGQVSAVIGTHTHVQTADERILPKGTAYLTDVGMTGSMDSVIGIKLEEVLHRFLTQMPVKFETAKQNPRLSAVLVEIDPKTGKSVAIQRLNKSIGEV